MQVVLPQRDTNTSLMAGEVMKDVMSSRVYFIDTLLKYYLRSGLEPAPAAGTPEGLAAAVSNVNAPP